MILSIWGKYLFSNSTLTEYSDTAQTESSSSPRFPPFQGKHGEEYAKKKKKWLDNTFTGHIHGEVTVGVLLTSSLIHGFITQQDTYVHHSYFQQLHISLSKGLIVISCKPGGGNVTLPLKSPIIFHNASCVEKATSTELPGNQAMIISAWIVAFNKILMSLIKY